MINNKKWSALIISIFIIAIISLLWIYLLEKIVPISRNVKWVENSNIAYYNANSWVEKALFDMTSSNPSSEPAWNIWTTTLWYNYSTKAITSTIPQSWLWNSEYSSDWNKIWTGNPVQLLINTNSIDWTNGATFYFRIPDISPGTTSSLSWALSGSWLINWVLSGSWKSLFASWETNMIKWNSIWSSSSSWFIKLWNLIWFDLNYTEWTFTDFYKSTWTTFSTIWLWNCSDTKCILKLSVVNPIYLSNWQLAPYIEYKLLTNGPSIPDQYASIKSDWYSYWYKRTINKQVRQLTTNEALDFTIFQ